ncbi:MAG TPA: hypothetical protein VD761_10210 [Solirubrobacterales bacterium]|nr:hypothetical protein [Solirubrobacterales bacterium]
MTDWISMRRGSFGLLLAALVFSLAAAPAEAAERHIDEYVGGLFDSPAGALMGSPRAIYEGTDANPATDKIFALSGERVLRLDPVGRFERTWGKDVIAGNGGTGAEICTVAADCKAGENGVERGELSNPVDLAVDQANGWVYVWQAGIETFDPATHVDKFDLDGNFLLRFGKEVNQTSGGNLCPRPGFPADVCKEGVDGSGAGELGEWGTGQLGPHLAVSPVAPHDVFVGDPRNQRIMQFKSDGSFVRGWGYDVAPGGTPAFEICTTVTGCQEGSPGDANGQFGSGSLNYLAVDSNGVVYASDSGNPSRIVRFDSDQFAAPEAGLLAPITATDGTPAGPLLAGVTRGLAVDPATNHLFVLRAPTDEDGFPEDPPFTMGEVGLIQEIDTATGTLVSSSPPPADAGQMAAFGEFGPSSLVLQASTGNMYVAYNGNSEYNFPACEGSSSFCLGYFVLDADGFNPHSVTIDPPSGETENSVVLQGTITPRDFVTYRFEYSKDGVDWIRASAGKPLASSGTEVVSETLTGLEPSTDYRVRLVARKVFGSNDVLELVSDEELFTTTSVAPLAETLTTSQRTATSAKLYGRINPNNSPTTYYFEYGETEAYGSKKPIPDGDAGGGFGDQIVSTEISGLAPNTTYHYRIVAENDEGVSEGDDVVFTTRDAADTTPQRAYEMVTPPFKIVRAAVPFGGDVGDNPNPGVPSKDGDTVAWTSAVFPLTDDTRTGSDGDNRIIRRTPSGWVWQTRNTLPSKLKVNGVFQDVTVPGLPKQDARASSADFETLAWYVENGELIQSEAPGPNENNPFYTRRDGTGVEGFTPWILDTRTELYSAGSSFSLGDNALINDAGTAMVRWGGYWGLAEDPETPGDDDPSDEQQLEGQGRTVYFQQAKDPLDLPSAPKDLVNECTGSGAGATLIPVRVGAGTATDTLEEQPCEEGNLVSRRGASVGGVSYITAMSNDGRRVFFNAPEAESGGGPAPDCASTTGAATSCPPQLYVRQYDENGENPVVRWISRARGVGPQRIGELGGAFFQGASEDGRYVYFKTNTPLLPGDPNAGDSITDSSASPESWDLYRYELPAGPASDPGDGTLTRITAGPTGSADPNTNSGHDSNPLRFLSDDGMRAYFLTSSPLAGADTVPPAGGVTTPAGTVSNQESRNLYFFDDHAVGADRYRFIARLPMEDVCATRNSTLGNGGSTTLGSCFRGNRDGDHVLFFSAARLTSDDQDDASDIYLYDAETDELIRVSAPPPGATPYGQAENFVRNADLGKDLVGGDFNHVGAAGHLDSAGGWGRGRYYNMAEDANGIVSVFFASKSQLVPGDKNGDHMDVYQWREGVLSLVSPASPGHYSFYSGNSVDGRDVFIFTSERIDPREIDDFDYDIYDYRVGGGFPYTPPPTPCNVLALQCEGNATAPPPTPAPSTAGFRGRGNVGKAKKCKKGQVRKKGRCVKATKKRHKAKNRHKANSTRKGASK